MNRFVKKVVAVGAIAAFVPLNVLAFGCGPGETGAVESVITDISGVGDCGPGSYIQQTRYCQNGTPTWTYYRNCIKGGLVPSTGPY
jgi:hypothetical protein